MSVLKGCLPQGGILWISSYRDDQRIFFGYSQLMFPFFLLYHLMLSGKFYGAEIRHGIFNGFVASTRDFSGF